MTDRSLAGRTACITGATGGLGGAIASRFADAGATLLLVGRSHERLQQLAGAGVRTFACDLADPSAPAAIAREAGAIDILVNNAAVHGPIGPLVENDWDEWERAFRVDFLAVAALCRLTVPAMRGGAKIINISGGGATGPRPNFTAYGSAKAALVRFSESLAQELQPRGIDVNCVAPGAMNTRLLREVVDAGREVAGAREVEIASRAEGEEACGRAAELCLFLASSASDGITGKLISAVWDPWTDFPQHVNDLRATDVYTLRRIVPTERGLDWGRD